MTNEVAIKAIQDFIGWFNNESLIRKALEMAIKALSQEPNIDTESEEIKILQKRSYLEGFHEALKMSVKQEPCTDAVSREAVINLFKGNIGSEAAFILHKAKKLPSVTQKSGKCKNCIYFEDDSVAKVDGIPLIVAHEICNKWGNGCKTSEDGYCYLFEPQESEV